MQVQQEVTKWLPKAGVGGRAGTRVGQATWRKLAVDSRTHVIEGQEAEPRPRRPGMGEWQEIIRAPLRTKIGTKQKLSQENSRSQF